MFSYSYILYKQIQNNNKKIIHTHGLQELEHQKKIKNKKTRIRNKKEKVLDVCVAAM